MTEAQRLAIIERDQKAEAAGILYAPTVEIMYPPQLAAELGSDGLTIPIHDILTWVAANNAKAGDQVAAKKWRSVRDRYYRDRPTPG